MPEIPDFSGMELEDLKREVEERTATHDELDSRYKSLMSQLVEVSTRKATLEKRLEERETLAAKALRERYIMQRHGATLIDALLRAEDFKSFLVGIEYIEAASAVSVQEVVGLRDDIEECEKIATQLGSEKDSVGKQLEYATAVLEEATRARDEKQRKADMVANTHLEDDGADWGAGEEKFVATWAPRIEAFVKGSPLEGQGEAFAKAAWVNRIDPRFSVAISNIESSKGRYCIRPYNAWGWGAADSDPYGLAKEWDSWEEAINAHAKGLADGYGYTVSVNGARAYCPSEWEDWYVKVVTDMNSI